MGIFDALNTSVAGLQAQSFALQVGETLAKQVEDAVRDLD